MTDLDGGTAFGKWTDPTSRLMYHDLTPFFLSGLNLGGRVVDLGGGNGLLRPWIPGLLTVDTDPSKQPDVTADITTWTPPDRLTVDLAVSRYVTHYQTDAELHRTFQTAATYAPRLALIAITTPKTIKDAHSVNEPQRHWRTAKQLPTLFDGWWEVTTHRRVEFDITADFYRHRLQHPNPTGHTEQVTVWHLERRTDV